MATVINDVTIEPKAAPPGEPGAAKNAAGGEGGKVPPDMQREIEKLARQARERAARLFAF
jgi:hypothetical protein